MALALKTNNRPVLPSEDEASLAERARRKLAEHLRSQEQLKLRLVDEAGLEEETVELPASAGQLLLDILQHMARGNAVTLLPIHAELTTQQAADLLNMSRPHLIHLLDEGKIPSHKVGSHRRIRAEDIFAYKREMDRKRREVLKVLAAHDQELGLE